MSSGITKTMPKRHCREGVDALPDGSLHRFEFHNAGSLGKRYVVELLGRPPLYRGGH